MLLDVVYRPIFSVELTMYRVPTAMVRPEFLGSVIQVEEPLNIPIHRLRQILLIVHRLSACLQSLVYLMHF
jgi:hypothetical protein